MTNRILKKSILAFVILLSAVTVIIPLFSRSRPTPSRGTTVLNAYYRDGDPMTADEFEVLRLRSGMTVDAMAAIGLSDSEVGTVLANMDAWGSDSYDLLHLADASVADTLQEEVTIRRTLRRGGTGYRSTDLSEAVVRSDAAVAEEKRLEDSLYKAVTGALSGEKQSTFAAIHDHSDWDVEAGLKVATLSEEEWLAVERSDRFDPEDITTEDVQTTNRIESQSDVILAKSSYSVRKDGVGLALQDYEKNR